MRNDFQRSLVVASARAARPGRVSLADALPLVSTRQSRHARRRAAQRNLGGAAIEYVMAWGRVIHRTGAVFYFLARKDIPAQHRHLPWATRLAGSVVLASLDGEVITLYRNITALRDIQRKMKYRIIPGEMAVCADVADELDDMDDANVADELCAGNDA